MAINANEIRQVYSGTPGCGCGCRGKYWEDARNINRIVKILNNRIGEVRYQDDGHVYALEDDTRYYWAYTKEANRDAESVSD